MTSARRWKRRQLADLGAQASRGQRVDPRSTQATARSMRSTASPTTLRAIAPSSCSRRARQRQHRAEPATTCTRQATHGRAVRAGARGDPWGEMRDVRGDGRGDAQRAPLIRYECGGRYEGYRYVNEEVADVAAILHDGPLDVGLDQARAVGRRRDQERDAEAGHDPHHAARRPTSSAPSRCPCRAPGRRSRRSTARRPRSGRRVRMPPSVSRVARRSGAAAGRSPGR